MKFKAEAIASFSDFTEGLIYKVEEVWQSENHEAVFLLADNKRIMRVIPANKFYYVEKTSPKK